MSGSTVLAEDLEILIPIENRITVRPIKAEDRSKGGLLIPDAAKERPMRGIILACGAKAWGSLKPGYTVIYGQFSGTEIEVGGEVILVLKDHDIFGYLSPDGTLEWPG